MTDRLMVLDRCNGTLTVERVAKDSRCRTTIYLGDAAGAAIEVQVDDTGLATVFVVPPQGQSAPDGSPMQAVWSTHLDGDRWKERLDPPDPSREWGVIEVGDRIKARQDLSVGDDRIHAGTEWDVVEIDELGRVWIELGYIAPGQWERA